MFESYMKAMFVSLDVEQLGQREAVFGISCPQRTQTILFTKRFSFISRTDNTLSIDEGRLLGCGKAE
jgi:hypothetical protein